LVEAKQKNLGFVIIYSDGEFKTTLILDFLVEQQREIGIILMWNFFASNHGGGAADADGNTARIVLKNYVNDNSRSLKDNLESILKLINSIKNHYAIHDTSIVGKKYADLQLESMVGIESKHCFSVSEGHVIGYFNSLTFSDPTIYTYTPIEHPEWCVYPIPNYEQRSNQMSLRMRFDNGDSKVKKCSNPECNKYYLHRHKKCVVRKRVNAVIEGEEPNVVGEDCVTESEDESSSSLSDEKEVMIDNVDENEEEIEIETDDTVEAILEKSDLRCKGGVKRTKSKGSVLSVDKNDNNTFYTVKFSDGKVITEIKRDELRLCSKKRKISDV